jgi:hypothetical protein
VDEVPISWLWPNSSNCIHCLFLNRFCSMTIHREEPKTMNLIGKWEPKSEAVQQQITAAQKSNASPEWTSIYFAQSLRSRPENYHATWKYSCVGYLACNTRFKATPVARFQDIGDLFSYDYRRLEVHVKNRSPGPSCEQSVWALEACFNKFPSFYALCTAFSICGETSKGNW